MGARFGPKIEELECQINSECICLGQKPTLQDGPAEDTFQPEQPVQQCLLFIQLIRFQHQRDQILVKGQMDKIPMLSRWGGLWPHYHKPGTGQHGQLYFELHVL